MSNIAVRAARSAILAVLSVMEPKLLRLCSRSLQADNKGTRNWPRPLPSYPEL